MKQLNFFIILLFLTSCSFLNKRQLASEQVSFNANAINTFPGDDTDLNQQLPILAQFEKDQYKLTYFATEHQYGTNSPIFDAIDKVVAVSKPKFMICEGFPTHIKNKNYVKERSEQCEKTHFEKCGDIDRCIFQATKQQIPVIGGEPNDIEVLNELKKFGYSELDYIGYLIIRRFPQYKDYGTTQNLNILEKTIVEDSRNKYKQIDQRKKMTLKELQSWYGHFMGRKYKIDDINADFIHGSFFKEENKDQMNPLQKMSHKMNFIRDRHILGLISQGLSEHSNVLVIYGSYHLIRSKKPLEEYFGQGRYEHNFNSKK